MTRLSVRRTQDTLVCIEERALRAGSMKILSGMGQCLGSPDQVDAFGGLLLESIDEALTDLLGRRAREAVYDYLERNRLVARNELPSRLDVFLRMLDDTFGKGSKTIGKVVAKKLYSKLEWEFTEVPGYELVDYVESARARVGREIVNKAKHV